MVYLLGEGVTSSGGRLYIGSLVIIKFNKDFEMADVKIFEKSPRSLGIGNNQTYSSYSTFYLANYFRGRLNHCLTQKSNEGNDFILYYLDYKDEKGYKGFTVNAVVNRQGEYKVEKSNWSREVHLKDYFKSKYGIILIIDYHRRDKYLFAHIEKFIL